MLLAMRRQIDKTTSTALLHQIRAKIPGVALRTTFIVGFPGETEEDFQELVDFVKEIRFDRFGVFQYSHEEDTAAYALEDDVPPEVKQERAARLMAVQQEISREINEAKIGSVLKVLIDRKEGGFYYGRTEYDSVEVDNEVIISADENYCAVGGFAQVEIIDAMEYDLIGRVVGN